MVVLVVAAMEVNQSMSQFIKQQRTKGHLQVASIYNSHSAQSTDNVYNMYKIMQRKKQFTIYAKFNLQYNKRLEGKYSLESTDPRESEIRAPPQPLPYLMPISPNTFFITKNLSQPFCR